MPIQYTFDHGPIWFAEEKEDDAPMGKKMSLEWRGKKTDVWVSPAADERSSIRDMMKPVLADIRGFGLGPARQEMSDKKKDITRLGGRPRFRAEEFQQPREGVNRRRHGEAVYLGK